MPEMGGGPQGEREGRSVGTTGRVVGAQAGGLAPRGEGMSFIPVAWGGATIEGMVTVRTCQ
jgi:hypothetical protein